MVSVDISIIRVHIHVFYIIIYTFVLFLKEPINDFVKSSTQGRINFVAAKQKHVSEFVASKTKKRAEV